MSAAVATARDLVAKAPGIAGAWLLFGLVVACRSAPRAAPSPRALDAATADGVALAVDAPEAVTPGTADTGPSLRPFIIPAPRPFRETGAAPRLGPCRGARSLRLAARPTVLLEGRLRLRLPSRGERGEPRGYAHRDTREERLELTLGRGTMHLAVRDRFRRDAGTLREALDRLVFGSRAGRAWTTPAGLRAIAIVPRPGTREDVDDPDAPGESVLRAWVALPDDSVVTLFFHVSPEATAADTGCAALATSIVDTITGGPRALDVRGGSFRPLPGWRVDIPEGWARQSRSGTDWWHVTYEKVTPLVGPTTRVSFFIGDHVAQDDSDWPTAPGAIHGVPVTWREIDNGHWHVRETMLAPSPDSERLVLRYDSQDPDGYREAEAVVGTLRPGSP